MASRLRCVECKRVMRSKDDLAFHKPNCDLKPNPKDPRIFWCETEKKYRFDFERETCFNENHSYEPIKGKLFTETDEYFEEIEKEAGL